MKKIVNIIKIIIILIGLKSFGQQIPHYTQYMYNMNVLNPAYAGARADLSIGLLTRSQWVGIDGAPKTNTFSVNSRVKNGIGLGLSVVQDKIGLFEDTNINLDISYTLITSQKSRLALGIKTGFSNFTNNLSQGITPDNDVYEDLTGNNINFGVGAYYYNQSFYAGLSIPKLLKTPKFTIENNYTTGISEHINLFATAGKVFIVDDNLKFKPSTLIKYSAGLPLSFDINSNFLYKDQFEVGLSYRYDDSVSGMFAIILDKRLRIGYAYDYTLTNLGNFNSGSHEIMLLFDIDFSKRNRWLTNSSCYF